MKPTKRRSNGISATPLLVRKTALLLFGVLLFLDFGNGLTAGNVKLVKVFISCSGNDLPGVRLCSAVKEKIRASAGFELVQSTGDAALRVHMFSVDIGNENLASAAGITFTVPTASPRVLEVYLDASVFRFGVSNLDETADSVFAHIDENSEFLPK